MRIMRKTSFQRAATYLVVGLTCALFNIFVYHQLLDAAMTAFFANIVAFLAGSQPNFWLHDRKTFGDINTEVSGWFQRWKQFMVGNTTGFLINTAMAAGLLFVLSETRAHLVALMLSGLFNIIWNVSVPFRDRNCTKHFTHTSSPSIPVVSVEH